MIQANNVTLRLGKRALFEDVNIKFTEGNCYGLIGANGAGKSTFLKILSGEIEPSKGDVSITSGQRLSVLKQDHYQYDDHIVLDTVMMGNQRLYEIMKEKEAIYAKEDFTDEDGIRASELEGEFADMNGWEAESDAATLLNGLGIPSDIHYTKMADLNGSQKVKVLLAQALFGNPDILLLDEPTNHLDLDAIYWLEEFLINFDNTVIVVSHDRYFLNKVCTHIADIDYAKIQLFSGNYDFWYESSQLLTKQMKEANKKKEEKMKELQDFIARFSANASKSKQATSRKKALDKIQLDDLKPSSRKYPYINFKPNREIGNDALVVENLTKTIDGVKVLDNISFLMKPTDKIAFVGPNTLAATTLFKILSGEMDDVVSIFFTNNHILFEFDQTIVVSRLIEGEYFRINQMLSSDYETKVTINKKEFLDCIERATILIRENDKKPLILNVGDNTMELKLNSSFGSMNAELMIHKTGKDIMIGFNPKFLIDALRVIDDEEINIYMMNPKSPCFIKDEDATYIYLILPVNFNAAAV